jgi:hypothetical protein
VADSEIEAVLRDLLGREDLSAETREELQDFRAQAHAGTLDAADRGYILALAQRLTGKAPPRPTGAAANDTRSGYDDDDDEVWRERALAAEAKLQAFKDAVERTIGGAATLAEGPEAQARRELYDRMKQEIERIEKGQG